VAPPITRIALDHVLVFDVNDRLKLLAGSAVAKIGNRVCRALWRFGLDAMSKGLC